MKRYLIAVVLFLLAGLTLRADTIRPPTGFVGKVWHSTFALYDMDDNPSSFTCTAEAIAKTPEGYTLLSAGHCAEDVKTFAVSEEIGGPLMPVTVKKAYRGHGKDTADFTLFELKTTRKYPVMQIGTDDDLRVGTRVINVHFAEGAGEQLSYGYISSQPLLSSRICTPEDDGCLGNFFVQEFTGRGASGSAVVSLKTHKIIGLMVTLFREGNMGAGIEPISLFSKFLAGPNQFQSQPIAKDDPSLRIPEAVYQSTFGPSHPFTLTATGPNPRFIQGGYTFAVDIMGMELFEDYYTDPVFINEEENGTFRLVSTKRGYSVGVAVVQAPEQK